MRKPLLDTLSRELLLGDGAMGTLLLQQGTPVGACLEWLNISDPNRIEDVHRSYIQAGSRVIETNTFGAHREKLSRFGHEDDVFRVNQAGARIARAAAGDAHYVLGSVGAIANAQWQPVNADSLTKQYAEQILALSEGGVDGILFETFLRLEELFIALQTAKRETSLPVVCQLTIEDPTTTLDGVPVRDALKSLLAHGADVVGFNCHVGPAGLVRAFDEAGLDGEILLSVYPNAGLPEYVDGAYVYRSTPDYFAQNALRFQAQGVRLIGGCCGTTPAHIRAMADALQGLAPRWPHGPHEVTLDSEASQRRGAVLPRAEARDRTDVASKKPDRKAETLVELAARRHTVVVELDPPRDLNVRRYMRGATALRDAGADAITLADNSLAQVRMSNVALAAKLINELGVRPLVHMACRDRNAIGQYSHLMGLHALGVDHLLAITGDPVRLGDMPGASAVYDMTSRDLLRMIKQLNEGLSFTGKPIRQRASFVAGAAFNPNVRRLAVELRRLEKKVEAGADFVLTQPVFDPKLMEAVAEQTHHLNIPVFIGIYPLPSSANAEFLHNEMPGIEIPESIRLRMAQAEGESAIHEGIAIAKDLLDVAMGCFHGIYLMTPFSRVEMTVELTTYIHEHAKSVLA